MDIANHGTQGFISHYINAYIVYFILAFYFPFLFFIIKFFPIFYAIFGLIISMYPDWNGERRAIKDGVYDKEGNLLKKNYDWYDKVHKGLILKWMNIFIGWKLHISQDFFTHDHEELNIFDNKWYANINYKETGIDAKFTDYFKPSMYAEKMWYESLTWLINLILLPFIIYHIIIFYFN